MHSVRVSRRGAGRELVVTPSMITLEEDLARSMMSPSMMSPESTCILTTGRPETMALAAWDEPANCDNRGINELGREGAGD